MNESNSRKEILISIDKKRNLRSKLFLIIIALFILFSLIPLSSYFFNVWMPYQKIALKVENTEFTRKDLVEFNNFITINNSNFIMCKFPTFGVPVNFYEKLRYLINNNYLPIITNIVYSPLGKNKKILNDLFEIGCLFDIDINDFFEFKNKSAVKIIKFLENQNSIITISGFNKIEELEKSFERFSKQTGLERDKLEHKYCWSNPNLIISN